MVISSHCHIENLHIVIWSYCHTVVLSFLHISKPLYWRSSYTVIPSYGHIVILKTFISSYRHIVILTTFKWSYCHTVILSYWRPSYRHMVILKPVHIYWRVYILVTLYSISCISTKLSCFFSSREISNCTCQWTNFIWLFIWLFQHSISNSHFSSIFPFFLIWFFIAGPLVL